MRSRSARRETDEVRSNPEALRSLAEAHANVRTGDVLYGSEAVRALVDARIPKLA